MKHPLLNHVVLLWHAGVLLSTALGAETLSNRWFTAEFAEGGLQRLQENGTARVLQFRGESGLITLEGEPLSLAGLSPRGTQRRKGRLIYTYETEGVTLEVVYELRPEWRFITKHFVLTLPAGRPCTVDWVGALQAELLTPVAGEHRWAGGSRGVFLRFGDGTSGPGYGAFFTVQNPFLNWDLEDGRLAMSYAPEMPWQSAYGPFESDRVCIGLYELSGQEIPAHNLPEWAYEPDAAQALAGRPQLDWAEVQAMTRCVAAFVMRQPKESLKVHIPWCENDYQIDIGTAEGREEYKRIIDQATAVGCEHVLLTPENSLLAPRQDNTDAWAWENVLWLGLGQKLRKGEWDPATDPVPASVQEMLDYARERKVQVMAYAYPTLGWTQNPEWTAWCGGRTGGYLGADTGVRSFQDWFVDTLVAFQKRTGISGYSFDHWWIAYEATDGNRPTSKYGQWYGCRRILMELRRRIPDVVIDGRQQYQWFGPWTWVGGSYPHPSMNDEQPGSFENFPDLHFSRVSAQRQRYAAWWYRFEQFTPLVLVPGYMTHQTPRNDARNQCVRDRPFRIRDLDYLGWRHSVLSSIATAPFNNVVDFLPARDPEEFQHFSREDQRWLRDWLKWTDTHRELLAELRPIIGPPVLGRIDGTAAIRGDQGFVFLFNPNYRLLPAEFTLDASIGLTRGDRFVFRELHPRKGRLLGPPEGGGWQFGQQVRLEIKGPQALVLELVSESKLRRPAVLNGAGRARLSRGTLELTEVSGECGTTAELSVLLPSNAAVTSVRVNGLPIDGARQRGEVISVPVAFGGQRFAHCQSVATYDPAFRGGVVRGEFTIPQRVFDQLAARSQAWPISYTEDDLLATWLGSDRLLLYVHIADPDDTWSVELKIDDEVVQLRKAYSDVYPLGRERTFTGFYTDVSALAPGHRHRVELSLPDDLEPGQFQGLFFENVEAEYTAELVRSGAGIQGE